MIIKRADVSAGWTTHNRRHVDLIDFIQGQNINNDISILDVGCGKGLFIKYLQGAGFKNIHGCDCIDPDDLIIPANYQQVDLNVDRLPYDNQSFEVVVCSDVLEHLENPARALREISRVLKTGGCAFITLPNAFNIFQRICLLLNGNSTRYKTEKPEECGHISIITTNVLESLCRRAGLKIERQGRGFIYIKDRFILPRLKLSSLFSFNVYYLFKK